MDKRRVTPAGYREKQVSAAERNGPLFIFKNNKLYENSLD